MRFPEFTDEWMPKTINDLATVLGGGTPDTTIKSYWDGNIQWFTPSEIGKSKYVSLSSRTITEDGLNNSSAKLLPSYTILLSSRATVGECSITLHECATNQGFQSLIAKNCDIDFLYYLIQTKKKDLIRKACGSTFLEISANEVRKIRTNVPSNTEQKKIGALLSLIDKRIETQNKIIEDLRLLRDAISVCLLSPKSDWKCYKVSEIADIGRGRVISSKEIANQNNPRYPVYSSQTSNEGIMGYLDDYAFDGEYITWTTDGANAGTVFYRNGRFNCTNVCGTLKLHYQFDAYYCSLVLANATKKYVSVNLANPKLMNNTMAAIKLYLPPFQEQKRMPQLFRKMDENITIEHKLFLSEHKQKYNFFTQLFISTSAGVRKP